MMTVRLIAHTPEPEKVVAAAAKLCYSDAHITDLLDGLTEEKTAKFLTMLSDLGHALYHNPGKGQYLVKYVKAVS